MTQDPALIEDSPAIRAAVAEERRFNGLESDIGELKLTLNQVLVAVNGINTRLDTQNGRVGKTEAGIAELKSGQAASEARIKDRRLWERIDSLEGWQKTQDKATAREEGAEEAKVSLRTSDKFWFGTFITIAIAAVGIIVRFF